MLAQNFMTAEALGLEPQERSALIDVLGAMERGELEHGPLPTNTPYPTPAPAHFNLAAWRCGTCACIGGWADYFMGERPHDHNWPIASNLGLDRLFYPDSAYEDTVEIGYRDMASVTVDQAAAALRNYLAFGDPGWPEIFSQKQS